ETLLRFVTLFRAGRYSRTKGRLSSWLLGIARNCIAGARERAIRRGFPRSATDNAIDQQRLSAMWAEERERAILRESLRRLWDETALDERTLMAFDLFALRGGTASAVAHELGIKTNDVYVAKHRCLRRLRGIVNELSNAYDDMEANHEHG
ncbi:MAG: sigma-70 family RNA polymerase sigma factor, partial [Planctomycetota bacterium]